MLPKTSRLNLKTDFKWVAQGQKIESAELNIFLRRGQNLLTRVGIATSSKQFKTAVDRNRSRRLVSKAMEDLIEHLPASLNIVILPKQPILQLSSAQLTDRLRSHLKI